MTISMFEQSIDVILEDISFESASEALEDVNTKKIEANDAEKKLQQEIDALNGQLAIKIRRAEPRLKIILDRHGNCVVRYKRFRNCLVLTADPKTNGFKCGDSPFEKRFRRYHGHTLAKPEVLGDAIATFFRQNYRSLK